MAASMTFTKNAEGTFDVKLNGGSPWGFTLQGGSEFHSKLCVSKVSFDVFAAFISRRFIKLRDVLHEYFIV